MVKNRQMIFLSLVFLLSFFVSMQPEDVLASNDKVWKLRWWTQSGDTPPQGPVIKEFVKSVKEKTGGRVTIEVYWNESLIGPKDALMGLKSGIVDAGNLWTGIYTGEFPVSEVVQLPFTGIDSPYVLYEVLNTLYSKGLMKEYDNKGFKFLGFQPTGYMGLLTNFKITSMDDLKGKKIRVHSGPPVDAFKELGATPVSVLPSEIYMSLERGVLDGCTSEPGYLVPTKIHEVGKYYLTNPLYCGAPFFLAVNQKVWDSFPDDIKSIMESCFKQFSIDWIESAISTRKDLEDVMKRDGVIFNTISEEEYARWREKSKSAVNNWIERMNDLGYPGQEIVDIAMEVIENYGSSPN